jgi:hypothetical protein
MGEFFGVNSDVILLINLALVFLLFVIIIVLWAKLAGMKKNYKRILNGSSSMNVEELLINIQEKLNHQEKQTTGITSKIESIRETIKKMKSKVGIHRYNAFGDSGSDLSFSVAVLDDYEDGILLTGIHSREQTYMYAKPIQNGQSAYSLSPEEKEAINRTSKQQQPIG